MEKRFRAVFALLVTLLLLAGLPLSALANDADASKLGAGTIATQAADAESFSITSYTAKIWAEQDSPPWRSVNYLLSNTTPSQLIVDSEDSDDLEKSIAAWRAVRTFVSPSKAVDFELDDKGYCEAVVFSIFLSDQTNESNLVTAAKSIESDAVFLGKTMSTWTQLADRCDSATKLASLSGADKKKLESELAEKFLKDHPVLSKAGNMAEAVSTIFDAVETVGDAIERLGHYTRLVELSDGTKQVLQQMADTCPQSSGTLREALADCAKAMQSAEAAINVNIIKASKEEGAKLLGAGVEEVYKLALRSNPYTEAFMSGAKIGDAIGAFVCKKCFSTDKTIEQFVKMQYLKDATAVLRNTVLSLRVSYAVDPSEQAAAAFKASVDSLVSAQLLSCDFAREFAGTLYEDALFGVRRNSQNYTSFVKSVDSIRNSLEGLRDSLYLSVQYELEAEYPDIYEVLYTNIVHVQKIEFAEDEAVLGLNDSLLWVSPPTISPANATNQTIHYTSSDASVLEIEGTTPMCTAHKAGTVTVTATSDDKGYTDTITVKVVEGRGSDNTHPVLQSGQCGDHAFWELCGDGTLSIYGSGDMWDYDSTKMWHEANVKEIQVSEGITSIGKQAFQYNPAGALTFDSAWNMRVSLPATLERIGEDAFSYRLESGSIGDIRWYMEKRNSPSNWYISNQVLVISGSGKMPDFANRSACPFPAGRTIKITGDFTLEITGEIENIGSNAFSGGSFVSAKLPASVSSLGADCFSGCTHLTKIEIPGLVTSIGERSFKGCTALTSVSLSDGLNSIPEGCFSGCTHLNKIEIPASVSSLGSSAFEECNELASVSLPKGIAAVPSRCFSGCSKLASCTVPSSVSSIGEQSFKNCASLDAIKLPDSVNSIGKGAFENCTSLASISIPAKCTVIARDCFSGCSSLADVSLPNGIEAIERCAFAECEAITSFIVPSRCTSIGIEAFSGCSKLSTLFLPEGLLTIDNRAFSNCVSLRQVDLPASINEFGSNPFEGCQLLTSAGPASGGYKVSFKWDDKIPARCFSGMAQLKEVVLPPQIESIGNLAFRHCEALSDIVLPSKLKTIGNSAFAGCTSLAMISIPDSVTELGEAAFSGCSSLRATGISENTSITWLRDDAYSACLSISEVVIPARIGGLGANSFSGCTSLERASIKAPFLVLGRGVFYGCSRLKAVDIAANAIQLTEYFNDSGYGGAGVKDRFGADAFMGIASGSTINVSARSVADQLSNPTVCDTGVTKVVVDPIAASGKITQTITASNKTVAMGQTASLGAKASGGGMLTYRSSNESVVKVDSKGKVTPLKAGKATVTITAAEVGDYAVAAKQVTITITKGTKTITAKGKNVAVKASAVKKKARSIAANKAFSVSGAVGKVTFAKVSGNAKIAVSSAGKVTLKKGLGKGAYSVKVRVSAKGDANWMAKSATVTLKVRVK